MKSVYGLKRLAANAKVHETWMDRFTQLEPEDGFRAVARQAWIRSAPMPNGASAVSSLNGRMEMKPVYGKKVGVRETWMDLFTRLEPEDGFREIVERAWNWSTPSSDEHLTALAA
jgi:hypothetical protein